MQQPNKQQPANQPETQPKAMLGFIFSLLGGILILLRGVIWITIGDIITLYGSEFIRHRYLAGIGLSILGGVAVLFGILIIVGAYLIWNQMEMTGGIIVLVFALLSIIVGSGWLIGLLLGVIGGILALIKK